MKQLHPDLLTAVKSLPKNRPITLFTRHSIREQTDNELAGYELQLTPEGVELATQWGAALDRPIENIYSSPVQRCIETAEAMLQGASATTLEKKAHPDINKTVHLVEPGCYVQDIRHAGPAFFELGMLGFANKHLKEGIRGVLPPGDGAKKLLNHFHSTQANNNGLSLHVSHDTILTAFISYLNESTQVTDKDWPWMLEGCFLWFDRGQLHWVWRNQKSQRPLTDFGLV